MFFDMNTYQSTEYADFEWATKLNRLILDLIGIWPKVHKNWHKRILSNLRVIFSLFLLAFSAIPSAYALVKNRDNILSTIDDLQLFLPLCTSILKLIAIWWKKTDLTLLMDIIANDWLKHKTSKELSTMIKYARITRAINIFSYFLISVGFTLLVLPSFMGKSFRYKSNLTDSEKPLPFYSCYPYDKNRSPYFEITFIAQCFAVLILALSYVGTDNLLGLLIFHLCGQMQNLKGKLIDIKQFKTFHEGLSFIVQDHTRLIKYFESVESTFSILLLALLIYFASLFCLNGVLIITLLEEKDEISIMRFIYLMIITVATSGLMCLYCAVGEFLIMQCDRLYNTVYDSKWYQLEAEEAKTLVLILIRTSKPFYITAGKMFPMTMSMFCNLLKTSAGYMSVLLTRRG